MRFVQSAERVPHTCPFFPQIGGTHPEGFVVADSLIDNHFGVAVSVVALREIAKRIPQAGLAPRDDLTLAQAENEALKRELEDLRAQLTVADDELNAIHTIRGRGYSVQKKPGRKPAAKAA